MVIKDFDGAAEILLKAAPELESELVHASQNYLADQYQADASMWGQMDQQRWDDFFSWVSDQGFNILVRPGAGTTTDFISAERLYARRRLAPATSGACGTRCLRHAVRRRQSVAGGYRVPSFFSDGTYYVGREGAGE